MMNSQSRPSLLSLAANLVTSLVPIAGVVFLAIGFSGLLVVGFGYTSGVGVLLSGGLVSVVAFLAYATQLSRTLLGNA